MVRSDERRSVCASPRKGPPARVHFCFIDAESVDARADVTSVAKQVVAPLGLSGLARMQREADVVGAILGRMRAMARGRLPEENPPALSPVVCSLTSSSFAGSSSRRRTPWCGPITVSLVTLMSSSCASTARRRICRLSGNASCRTRCWRRGSDASLWESSAAGVTPRLALTASIRDRF